MKCIGHEKLSIEDIKVGKWYDNPVFVTGIERSSDVFEIEIPDSHCDDYVIIEGNVMFTIYTKGNWNDQKWHGEFLQGTEVYEWVMEG